MGNKETKVEIMNHERDMPSEQKEVQKRKSTLKKINIDEQKKAKQELDKPIDPLFERKLKKTETVKIKIKENEMEKVVLKHHEFELHPKEIIDEHKSNVKLKEMIYYSDDEEDIKDKEPKIKSRKQIKKKKIKKPLQIEGIEPDSQDKDRQFEDDQTLDKIKPNEKLKELPEEVASEEIDDILKQPGNVQDELSKKIGTKDDKIKQNVTDKMSIEPAYQIKLRKTETTKIKIEESKIEPIDLKHHVFEQNPQDHANEGKSKISLNVQLQYSDDEKCSTDKVESKKLAKKKKAKKTVTDSDDTESKVFEEESSDGVKEKIITKKINKSKVLKQDNMDTEKSEKDKKKQKGIKIKPDELKHEEIKLRHHNFESTPQNIIEEMKTNVKLSQYNEIVETREESF